MAVSPKSVLQWIVGVLLQNVSFEAFAEVVIRIASMVFDKLVQFIRAEILKQDERLKDYVEKGGTDVDAEKEVAFKTVVSNTQAEFSASPSYTPKGLVEGLVKLMVYSKNNPTDERTKRAKEKGLFNEWKSEDISRAVDSLNKGWVNSR